MYSFIHLGYAASGGELDTEEIPPDTKQFGEEWYAGASPLFFGDWSSNALYPAQQSSMWMELATDACEWPVISSSVLPRTAKWKE